MCSAKMFFEQLIEAGELRDYLFDAFERHSHPDDKNLDEMGHACRIKDAVASELTSHATNKAVSHEMWAVTTLICQFQRATNPEALMPAFLGPDIYNHPDFVSALSDVREFLQTTPHPERVLTHV